MWPVLPSDLQKLADGIVGSEGAGLVVAGSALQSRCEELVVPYAAAPAHQEDEAATCGMLHRGLCKTADADIFDKAHSMGLRVNAVLAQQKQDSVFGSAWLLKSWCAAGNLLQSMFLLVCFVQYSPRVAAFCGMLP